MHHLVEILCDELRGAAQTLYGGVNTHVVFRRQGNADAAETRLSAIVHILCAIELEKLTEEERDKLSGCLRNLRDGMTKMLDRDQCSPGANAVLFAIPSALDHFNIPAFEQEASAS